MANPEHVALAKQGADAIGEWLVQHSDVQLDLSAADLREVNLSGADLRGANFFRADISEADLRSADLTSANLHRAEVRGAYLCQANLSWADLSWAYLHRADLTEAELRDSYLNTADLSRAILRGTDLSGANLCGANLALAGLCGADLSNARCGQTVFARTDLSEVDGLESISHSGPSELGLETLSRSKGRLPESFLRGCGLSDWEIVAARLYSPDLRPDEVADLATELAHARIRSPIQISSLFISYCHVDSAFVDALEAKMNEKGIRSWRDKHDMKAGRMETQITRAISLNPTVVLVLSKHSVNSDWVEWEASKARELEKELKRDVLCPVCLDEAWKTCSWPGPLRRQIEDYHILDFSRWQDAEFMRQQFQKLVDGLGLFYGQGKDAGT